MSGNLRRRITQSGPVRKVWREWSERREARSAGTTPTRTHVPRRLLIAPVNSAGQAYAWARAAERLDGVAAANFMYRDAADVFSFPADHSVPTVFFRSNQHWQRAQRRAVTRRFTHVIIESGRQILGTEDSLVSQLDTLREHNIAAALLWHGSDIRIPSENARHEPDSPFTGGRYPETERLEDLARRNHALMMQAGLPVFVSTPDLLEEVPHATWLPVVVDVPAWAHAAPEPALTGERIVAVHAPSNAGLKGSELIGETMRRLHEEGIVEYRELRNAPSESMPRHYGQADIVLDQFAIGIYGVAACEAMAAGRLVVSHVSEGVRRTVKERTGVDLPIVETDAGSLEATLRAIVADRATYAEIARRGPVFAGAVHGGEASAAALADFLGVRPDRMLRDGVGD